MALALFATMLLTIEAAAEDTGSPLPFVLAAVIGGSLAVRRRWPIGAYLAGSAALLAIAAWFYDAGLYPYPNVIGLYAVGAYAATRRRAVVGLVIGLLGVAGYWALVPATDVPLLPAVLIAGWALAWAAGQSEQQRRHLVAERAVLATEAERRRQEHAVLEERERITRDVHDIVGHALNVMILQAGAGRRMLGRDVALTADALATVEAVGRDALAELDRTLGVLDPTSPRPSPGIDALGELAERVTGAGVPVRLTVVGEPRALPAGVDRAAYRVVQEALTNVAKHAPGAPTDVEIRYGRDALDVTVTDRPATPPAAGAPGRGIEGIRARVDALGGTSDIGPDARGGWRVRCTVPVAR
ncbi:sensor histidine kinase [Cellulomonas sp. S1-8]|uniref:sensor histidine kinase n=1 Tax=Cellulomonas sp. S1-8 TaxID=2904790 RepID=UPI002244899A|nr:histidine kinase [Cellulomonas sp. S1-8]UZN03701.1 histidine kinase [Cellulomonas sp. S1-8]